MKVEKAKIADIPQAQKLIRKSAEEGQMLARSLSDMYENIRDYLIIRENDEVVGCAALHVCWSDLAEVKSVAVVSGRRKSGIGRALVNACIEEAKSLDISSIFCLTMAEEFFNKLGFNTVDLMDLPRKVWGECQTCPKYPDCDEVAMVLHLKPSEKATW